MRHALTAASVILLLVSSRPVRGQANDPKDPLFQSVARFSVALDGTFGDEGRAVRAARDGMARGLDDWDATLRASESAFTQQLPGAAPDVAARLHVAIGAAFLDRGRLQDALRELEAGAHLDPGRADVFTFEGVAYEQLAGDGERAIAAFRKSAQLDPSNPVPAYLLARALAKSGKPADAVEAYRSVFALWRARAGDVAPSAHAAPFIRLGLFQERSGAEPFFPLAAYADGFALLERGEFAKGLDAFDRAMAADPLVATDVDPAQAMGMAASALRERTNDLAVRYARVAVERDPARADAHRLLGNALVATGQEDEGLTELRTAVRLSPRDERARLAVADALVTLRRYADAEEAYRDALVALPQSGRARYRLGRLYQRQNKTLDALAEFEAAARLSPIIGASRLMQAIGALNAAQQKFDAALQAYSARVDLAPNDADAHRVLGYTYSRLERRDEALAEFAIALWIAPGAPDVHVAMSQLHLRSGDFEAAAAAAKRAIALDPSNKQAHYSLATALTRLDRPGDAKPEFDAFERLQAEDTAAAARQMRINGFRREAAANLAQHDYQGAIAALRRALELAKDASSSDLVLIHEQMAAAYTGLGQADESRKELAIADALRRDAEQREADR